MFEVGQKVLCVDDKVGMSGYPVNLTAGSIYTIKRVRFPPSVVVPTVHLMECEHGPYYVGTTRFFGYLATRFRPIDSKDDAIEQFREMCRETEKKTILPVSEERLKELLKDVEL